MKICFVGKYPPIEGGVSMQTYWAAYGLAQRGHQVYVVTNAREVEPTYRLHLTDADSVEYEPQFPNSGGFVRLVHTRALSDGGMAHIPQSNPFVSKLAGAATSVIEENDCDIVFAYYLEPYGMAGHLAASWTGKPLLIQHAGSDIDRLMRVPELASAYTRVLRRAARILTKPSLLPRFLGLGVERAALRYCPPFAVPPIFSPETAPLTPGEIAELAATVPGASDRQASFDSSHPVIGMYGKPHETKGTFDLIESLGQLARSGEQFSVLLASGTSMTEQLRSAVSAANLTDRTWLLPFLPHWRVARLIRTCTAVCFLERNFSVPIHGPIVAREILSCGTCLVVSGEIASKQSYRDQLLDGHTAWIVPDPKDHDVLVDRLRRVVRSPADAARIGAGGRLVADSFTSFDDFVDAWGVVLGVQDEPHRRMDEPTQLADRLAEFLPWLAEVLGPEWNALLADFTAHSNALHGLRLAEEFCAFLGHRVDDLTSRLALAPGYLADILLYQSARLWTLRPPTAQPFGTTTTGPKTRSNVRIERFQHDVTPLFTQREQPGAGPVIVCFTRLANLAHSEIRINELTTTLLRLCDGSRTVAQISAALSPIPEPQIRIALSQLRRAGLATV